MKKFFATVGALILLAFYQAIYLVAFLAICAAVYFAGVFVIELVRNKANKRVARKNGPKVVNATSRRAA